MKDYIQNLTIALKSATLDQLLAWAKTDPVPAARCAVIRELASR